MLVKQCIAKIKHEAPDCKSTSGKSLQVWINEDGDKRFYSGFCFACGVSVPNPYGNNPPDPADIKVKTPEEIQEEIAEITSCPAFDLDHRSIEPDFWKEAGVRLLYSEYDGKTPYALAHGFTRDGKLVRWKIKLLGKKVMWSVGDTKENDPYNWEAAKRIGGKTLYITEGEEDCIALRQILKILNRGTQYEELDYAVISLTDGSDSVNKTLARKAEEIRSRWQQVVIVFDDDEPGRKGAKEACRILGASTMIAALPANDANDCLKRGLLKQTQAAVVWRASRPLPTALVDKEALLMELDDEVEQGVDYPWPKLTEMMFGQRRGEIITLGGAEGGGKTTMARQIAEHNIISHDWGVFTAFMEETPQETVLRMAGLQDGLPYWEPSFRQDLRFDEDKFNATCRRVLQNMEIWDRKQQGEDPYETWEGLKTIIRQIGHDIDMFVLDNLTIMSEGISASERNDFLGKVYADQVKLADDYQIQILDLSHLNPVPKGQRPHEDGGRIKKSDFTGSRAAAKYSHGMFGFERNSQAVDPNCSIIRGIKARKSGKTEGFKTYYDNDSGRIIQRSWDDALFETKEIVEFADKRKRS